LKAITYFKKALESNPDDFESAGTLSNIYSALGDDINAKKYREISDGLAQ
jgi:two-component SAPR family response regulator